jgi:hypothetical protein
MVSEHFPFSAYPYIIIPGVGAINLSWTTLKSRIMKAEYSVTILISYDTIMSPATCQHPYN